MELVEGKSQREQVQKAETQRPDGAVARGSKRLAERFHQLRTEHCRTGQHGGMRVMSVQDTDTGAPIQERQTMEDTAENSVGGGAERYRKREQPFKIRDLLADEDRTKDGDAVEERRSEMRTGAEERTRKWKMRGTRRVRRSRWWEQKSLFFSVLVLSLGRDASCQSLIFLYLRILGKGRRGQRELPRAAGGLREVAAGGEERGRTVHDIAMVRRGHVRSVDHHGRRHRRHIWRPVISEISCSGRKPGDGLEGTSKTKYRMPKSQRPDGTVAGSSKRPTSRFYQLKTGHCLFGQCLNWTKSRPTAQCWWRRCQTQTQDHLFKAGPEWKAQQEILWAEVLKKGGRRKSRWRIRNLPADGRCSQAVLDFLSAAGVGRLVGFLLFFLSVRIPVLCGFFGALHICWCLGQMKSAPP